MTSEYTPTFDELKQRLAAAEAELQALRDGRVDTIDGTRGPLVVRLAAAEAHADHVKQVLLATRRINQLIVSEDEPLRLIEQACIHLTETMGYLNAWVALVSATGEHIAATASSGFDGSFITLRHLLAAGEYSQCMRRALATDHVIVVQNPQSECPNCPLASEYGGRAGLSRCLRHGGTTYGILSVSVPATYAFDEEEQALFAEIAADLAFGLHKIEAANHLRESQVMLARTEGIAHVGSWEWNVIDDQVRWSEELFRIFQRNPAEGAPSFIEQETLYVSEDMARLRQAVEACLQSGTPYTLELRAIRADGQVRHCLAHGRVKRDADGRIHSLAGSLQDVTEQRQAEEALRQSEQRFRSFVENANDIVYAVTPEGIFTYVSPKWIEAMGEPVEAAIGRSFAHYVHPHDVHLCRDFLHTVLTTGEKQHSVEYRVRHADGSWRWHISNGSPLRDHNGNVTGYLGIARDVSERRRAEEAVQIRERYLQTILQTSADGFWVLDAQGTFIEVNDAYLAMSGYSRDELLGRQIGDLDIEDTPAEIAARVRRIIANGSELFETRHRRKDGRLLPVEISTTWMNEGGGRFVCFCRDLTDRKQREEQLGLLGQMLDAAPASISIHNTDGGFLYANQMTAALHGYDSEADFLAINLRDLDVPEYKATLPARFRAIAEEGEARFETAHFRKDGSSFPLEVLAKAIEWDGQKAVLSIATDISERKRAELELNHSHQLLRYIIEHTNGAVAVFDRELRFIYVSQRFLEEYNLPSEEIIGAHHYAIFPDLPQQWRDVHQQALAGKILRSDRDAYARADGLIDWTRWECRPWHQADGTIGGIIVYTELITEQVRAEEELRRREQLLQKIFEILPIGLWFADKHGTLLRGNPMGVKIWGAEPKVPISEYGVFKAWRLPSREPVQPDEWALTRTIRTGATIVDELLEIESFDGKRKTILNYTSPLLDDSGQVDGAIVVNLDISDRKALEEQLLQAHKMESVGRLAGGVAHDFNNMLGVILGYSEILLEQLEDDQSMAAALHGIQQAAQRSADLTRQLLAFARKQTVAPKVLDLNATVTGMLTMLRRLIGEDIDLAWLPGEHLAPVKMDPSQIDQVLANLCVNARDAIKGTGKVTIETSNVTFDAAYCAQHSGFLAGEYVLLAVSDNGSGMDRDTLAHLFEPFFTTKEMGKGTGLGLAMVYGIVKQNHGFVNVYSEPGQGTTFNIYLPRYAVKADRAAKIETTKPAATGLETILLVEDEPMILDMTVAMLERLGYTVLPAGTPGEAIRLAREYVGRIDLVMTDVVMPEMNGRELTGKLLSMRPDLKRLFMSGYTANVIEHHGVLDEGVHFMQKPFSRISLAAKVREALAEVASGI